MQWSNARWSRLNRRSFLIFLGAVIVLTVGISSCKKSQNSQQGQEKIRVGEVGSMTGSDATFGISTHQGIQLAIDELNAAGGIQGKKLELITRDDRGQANEAVLAIQQLIHQEKVVAVLGEVASGLSIAMAPIAQNSHVPLISPSSIHSKLTQQGEFIFRVCFVDQFQSRVLAEYALKNLKAKRAAILRDVKSDYSLDSSRIFQELFVRGGGTIVADQSYGAGDIDFKSQLTAIRAANPDLILVPGYYSEVGLISRQKKELGISAPMLGGDGWDSPQLYEIGGASLEGSYFVSHFSKDNPTPEAQRFIEHYQARYEKKIPDGLAALGYDAAQVLAEAMRKSHPLNSEEIRRSLSILRGFKGVTGEITIGPDRNAVKSAIVFRIDAQGKLRSVAQISGSGL